MVFAQVGALRILETHRQENKGLGGWEGGPGEYQERAPEVDKRQSRAGSGREQTNEVRDP